MRKLAHIGIPLQEKPANAIYLADAKLYITKPEDSKNNIEFLFFEPECQMPKVIQTNTHLAYFVDNIDEELNGAEILVPPFEPMPGVKCAFILEDGCVPVELMQQA